MGTTDPGPWVETQSITTSSRPKYEALCSVFPWCGLAVAHHEIFGSWSHEFQPVTTHVCGEKIPGRAIKCLTQRSGAANNQRE